MGVFEGFISFVRNCRQRALPAMVFKIKRSCFVLDLSVGQAQLLHVVTMPSVRSTRSTKGKQIF